MSAPVLFLDIDGVLNSRRGGPVVRGLLGIGRDHVERLNRVVEATGCKVVLSSSWRRCYGIEITQERLRDAGARFDLHDATPDCAQKVGALYVGAERGAEIREWLDAHPEVTRFAIVDDDRDMGPLLPQLVKTTFADGLQDEHVPKLIARLRSVP